MREGKSLTMTMDNVPGLEEVDSVEALLLLVHHYKAKSELRMCLPTDLLQPLSQRGNQLHRNLGQLMKQRTHIFFSNRRLLRGATRVEIFDAGDDDGRNSTSIEPIVMDPGLRRQFCWGSVRIRR